MGGIKKAIYWTLIDRHCGFGFLVDIKKNWTKTDKQVLKVKVESNRKQAYNDHRPRKI